MKLGSFCVSGIVQYGMGLIKELKWDLNKKENKLEEEIEQD
jgi:hypothetical protein